MYLYLAENSLQQMHYLILFNVMFAKIYSALPLWKINSSFFF